MRCIVSSTIHGGCSLEITGVSLIRLFLKTATDGSYMYARTLDGHWEEKKSDNNSSAWWMVCRCSPKDELILAIHFVK